MIGSALCSWGISTSTDNIFLAYAGLELLCSTTCYVIHILRTRHQIKQRNRRLISNPVQKLIIKEEVQKRKSSYIISSLIFDSPRQHWTAPIYYTLYRIAQDKKFEYFLSGHHFKLAHREIIKRFISNPLHIPP